jgi:hypothetical protein
MPVASLQEEDCEQYVHVSGQPPVLMLSSVHRCTCCITLSTSQALSHITCGCRLQLSRMHWGFSAPCWGHCAGGAPRLRGRPGLAAVRRGRPRSHHVCMHATKHQDRPSKPCSWDGHASLLIRKHERSIHVGPAHEMIQETYVQLFRTAPRFCFQSMVWAAADGGGSAVSSTGAGRAACLAALLVNSVACCAPTRSACAPRLAPNPLRWSRCPSDAASAILTAVLTRSPVD